MRQSETFDFLSQECDINTDYFFGFVLKEHVTVQIMRQSIF